MTFSFNLISKKTMFATSWILKIPKKLIQYKIENDFLRYQIQLGKMPRNNYKHFVFVIQVRLFKIFSNF